MDRSLLEAMLKRWEFTRSETMAILDSLTDEQLQFRPEGDTWQPMFRQFTCLGRSQMVYTQAIKTGTMDFSFFHSPTLPQKDQYQTVHDIQTFLKNSNEAWHAALAAYTDATVIQWPE